QKTLIVVGARSSLFLPFLNIGLVVIDEENDQSYKQEDGVIYNARDMAILKSKIEKTSILLVSATPSLETFKNCKEEKYHWVKIKSRFKDTAKPKIQVVDMKNSTKSLISKEFEIQIKDNLNNKKQSLILINRRGYAPVTLCIKCGKKRKCKYCDSSLVYHKEIDLLMCHQCGKKEVYESICNSCNNGKFIFVGTGLERVYEEVIRLFPKAKIIKLSSDYMNKEIFFKTLKKIENSKIDIIVGTQIISKGFDFGNLKSVFIVDFDIWFNNADIRTNEKVFQLTQQVAGRAGRRDEEGEVFIQTFDPNNKLLDYIAKNERDLFYYKELKIRSKNLLPPYAKLLSVTISSKDLNLAEIKAKNIRSLFLASKDLQVYGPIPAQIYYIKNNYRLKLLVKARNSLIIQKYLLEKNFSSHINAKVKIKFDVDPYNLY
ncbi:MAG: Primosomal protein N', partial [Alphaproteobacteria bacterium MarineAlpha9_Bin4]